MNNIFNCKFCDSESEYNRKSHVISEFITFIEEDNSCAEVYFSEDNFNDSWGLSSPDGFKVRGLLCPVCEKDFSKFFESRLIVNFLKKLMMIN